MLIDFEGVNCCGKSTVIEKISEIYELKNISISDSNFLGNKKIYDDGNILTRFLFYLGAVSEIYNMVEGNEVYLCDRGINTTVVSHNVFSGYCLDDIVKTLNNHGVIKYPDYVLFFDIDLDSMISRISSKKEKKISRWDILTSKQEIFEEINNEYHRLLKDNIFVEKKTYVIDARKPLCQVMEDTTDIFEKILRNEGDENG